MSYVLKLAITTPVALTSFAQVCFCHPWLRGPCHVPGFLTLAGAPLFGKLPGGESRSGGQFSFGVDVVEFSADRSQCWHSNVELLASLREDSNSHALHELTMADHTLGRMSAPVLADSLDLGSVRLVPRFGVEQGLKPDGSTKLRAVDHMSWSPSGPQRRKRTRRQIKEDSINGHCDLPGRVSHDHLDCLLLLLLQVFDAIGMAPWLWKADIDAAFRRVPLAAAHRWAAVVAYLVDGRAWASFHNAMPFGATSSVWAWHRVGALIAHLARRLLHIPVLRYVDDYFSVERQVSCCRFHWLHIVVSYWLGESALNMRCSVSPD